MRTGAARPRFTGSLPRSCDIAEWRLILLRDNELPEIEAAALERHLRRCDRCCESHRLLDGLFAVLRDEPIPEPEDPFWEEMAERIMARIRAISSPPGSLSWSQGQAGKAAPGA